MPINREAVARHGRAAIRHFPVWCRVFGFTTLFSADFDSGQGAMMQEDGGVVFDRGGILTVSKMELPAGIIEKTKVEVLSGGIVTEGVYVSGGTWYPYKVGNVTGTWNDNDTEVLLTLTPANG